MAGGAARADTMRMFEGCAPRLTRSSITCGGKVGRKLREIRRERTYLWYVNWRPVLLNVPEP